MPVTCSDLRQSARLPKTGLYPNPIGKILACEMHARPQTRAFGRDSKSLTEDPASLNRKNSGMVVCLGFYHGQNGAARQPFISAPKSPLTPNRWDPYSSDCRFSWQIEHRGKQKEEKEAKMREKGEAQGSFCPIAFSYVS